MTRGRAIALVGASGSHPQTVGRIVRALERLAPERRVVVYDLTGLDRRGTADYRPTGATIVKPSAADVGIASWFRTPGGNIMASGGVRAFARMREFFEESLADHDIGAILLCYYRGYPQQAMLEAARKARIASALVDEGPFSIPLFGNRQMDASDPARRAIRAVTHRLGLLPRPDHDGLLLDRIFATSQGRARDLANRGIGQGKIAVVGSPRFDELAAAAARLANRPARGGPVHLLWVHQPLRSDGTIAKAEADRAEAVLAGGIARLAAEREVRIGLRLHPRTNEAERRRIGETIDRLGLQGFPADGPLYDAFERADIAVGLYSSVLLEAAVCRLPVVIARLHPAAFAEKKEGAKARLITKVGFAVASDAQEAGEAMLAAASQDPAALAEDIVDQQMGPLDGTGSGTIARWLIGQAEGRPA